MLTPRSPPAGGAAALRLLLTSPFSTYSRSATRRPKRKTYHRESALDKSLDLAKLPAALLRLRALILASHPRPLLLRDLEKHVGFVHKWNLLSLLHHHPSVFRVHGGSAAHAPVSVSLSPKAALISAEETEALRLMEPIVVSKVRKLLMMSLDCQIAIEKLKLIAPDLGLSTSLTYNYPNFFSVKCIGGVEYLCLETWDSSLAVTAREERLRDVQLPAKPAIAKDGNYPGPFAFEMRFARGFRANADYLEQLRRWQRMEFPSPYLNARRVEAGTPQARKRVVAVLHELLSLTMEKRLTSDKIEAFHEEYQLPSRLLLCLVKNHGVFYVTNKGERSTVILKEGYDGSRLVEKCPLLMFRDRFASLVGRTCADLSNAVPA